MSAFLQTQATADFQCLGDACEDTCCKGWGMQLSAKTVEKYKAEAPELLDAVSTGEAEFIMKRDPVTDYCVKFDAGWCGVHAKYGAAFLGDACHFFPRATRAVGDTKVMTLAPSCPEATRLMLYGDAPFTLVAREDIRVPDSLKQYQPEALASDAVIALHQWFLDAVAAPGEPASKQLLRLRMACEGLSAQPVNSWPEAAAFYLKMADSRIPAAEVNPADALHVLNALQGLVGAAKATSRPRLMQVMEMMANAMAVTLEWETLQVIASEATATRLQDMARAWHGGYAKAYDSVLKRYLQSQLSLALFPFSGLGDTLDERVLIIAVRFATVQLALCSASVIAEDVLPHEDVVRIIQSLSRFMDHLADATFSLKIYHEVGWNRAARLRGLLGETAA